MANIQDSILQAVDTLLNKKVDSLKLDKTITATIVSCNNAKAGEYKVAYNGGNILAYADKGESYSENSTVYVLVPEGDFTKVKRIVGKAQAIDNDLNISFVSAALSDYNILGANSVKDPHKILPKGLSSYLKEDYELIYARDVDKEYKNQIVTIDPDILNNSIKEAEALMIEASFQTRLPKEHRLNGKGEYGLSVTLAFKDQSTNESPEKPALKYNTYVLDFKSMVGNPYNYPTFTEQYTIVPIDPTNFSHVENILFFSKGFVEEDDIVSAETLWGDDIFIKDIELNGLQKISSVNDDGYKLSISMPRGNSLKSILRQDELTAISKMTFKNTTNLSDQTMFYWFKKDNRVVYESTNWHRFGGAGWAYLEEKGSDYTFVTNGAENRAYENKYLCVAVYKETEILKTEFTIYNDAAKRDLSITSDLGVQFSFDLGSPTLTCLVNGKSKGFEEGETNAHPDEFFRFVWSKTDSYGNATVFDATKEEKQKEYDDALAKPGEHKFNELSALKQQIATLDGVEFTPGANTFKYPVKSIDQTAVFSCSVYLKDTADATENEEYNIGSAKITLQNAGVASSTDYNIIIENGDQVFQYSESGVSPDDKRNDSPQVIKPLNCHFFDPAGLEVDSTTYDIKWLVPLENTLIKAPKEMQTNPANGKAEWNTSESYQLAIKSDYDYSALNNQITAIVTYRGEEYRRNTTFLFTKIGENGTNGTDVVAKISPISTNYSILDYEPLTMQLERGKQIEYNTGESAASNVLKFRLYQRNEEVVDLNAAYAAWNVAGGTNKSKYLTTLGKGSTETALAWSEHPNGLNNQIVRGTIKYSPIPKDAYVPDEGESTEEKTVRENKLQQYYAFYPIPVINYFLNKESRYKVSINNRKTLRSITYNADGRNPLYNRNQGIFISLGENIIPDATETIAANEVITGAFEADLNNISNKEIKTAYIAYKNNVAMALSNKDLTLREKKEQMASELETLRSVYIKTQKNLTKEEQSIVEKYTDLFSEIVSGTEEYDTLQEQEKTELAKIAKEEEAINALWNQAVTETDAQLGRSGKYFEWTVQGGKNEDEAGAAFKIVETKDGASTEKGVTKLAGIGITSFYLQPNDVYDGAYCNNLVHGVIKKKESDVNPEVEIWIPIHISLNTHGLQSLNAWDGNHVEIDEDKNYILAPQIGAGYKSDYKGSTESEAKGNVFTGILMGTQKTYDSDESKTGLFGYSAGRQSIFLDAETGSATFGLPESQQSSNNEYTEGRITFVPNGTSEIGAWKIGNSSLFNIVGLDNSYYRESLINGKKIRQIDPAKLKKYKETNYKISIPHDKSGILLSADPAYLSIKGRSLTEKDNIDYAAANTVVQEGDTFELQFDPQDPSIFTVYRHTSAPENASLMLDDNYNIVDIKDNNIIYSTPETVFEDPATKTKTVTTWRINRLLDTSAVVAFIKEALEGTDNKLKRTVAYHLVENDKNNSFEGRTITIGRNNYKDSSGNIIQDQARKDFLNNNKLNWHREAKVGINNQGRFYTNALKDSTTALTIGNIGAFGRPATATQYVGATFDVGNGSNSNTLIKMFTDSEDIDNKRGTLYVSGSTDLTSEYQRPIKFYGKTIDLFASNESNVDKSTILNFSLSKETLKLQRDKQLLSFTKDNALLRTAGAFTISTGTVAKDGTEGSYKAFNVRAGEFSNETNDNIGFSSNKGSITFKMKQNKTLSLSNPTFNVTFNNSVLRLGTVAEKNKDSKYIQLKSSTADKGLLYSYTGWNINSSGSTKITTTNDAQGIQLDAKASGKDVGSSYVHLTPSDDGYSMFSLGSGSGSIISHQNLWSGYNGIRATPGIETAWLKVNALKGSANNYPGRESVSIVAEKDVISTGGKFQGDAFWFLKDLSCPAHGQQYTSKSVWQHLAWLYQLVNDAYNRADQGVADASRAYNLAYSKADAVHYHDYASSSHTHVMLAGSKVNYTTSRDGDPEHSHVYSVPWKTSSPQ